MYRLLIVGHLLYFMIIYYLFIYTYYNVEANGKKTYICIFYNELFNILYSLYIIFSLSIFNSDRLVFDTNIVLILILKINTKF